MPNPKGKQLWVFEDNKSLNPSCRVLLDGATCLWATSTDVILRLHPSHKEPEGDMVARCDHGYCLLLRPVSSSPAAQADLHALVASTDPLALKSSNATAPASHPNPPGPRPPDPSGPRPPTPSVSRVEGGAGSSRGGNVSVPEGGRSSRVGSGGGPEGAGAPSAQAPMGWEQEWTEQLEALPGESDLEFAVRLASAMEVQQGHGQEGHVQSPPPQAPAPPPLVSQPQGASPSAPAGSSGHSGPPSRPTPQTQPSLTYADLVAPPAKWVEPSAPTLTEEEEDSQLFCVVCLSAPRAVGLLHGSTVHQCVCRECAARIETGIMLCPLCRQTVERVLDVYE